MDIKAHIEKIVNTVKTDDNLREQFQKEPAKAVEKILGVNLPDEVLDKVVQGVKGKISLDKVGDKLGSIKKLF